MKKLRISIDLPTDIPAKDEGLRVAERTAKEWGAIKLWEAGHLSTREAAKTLDLTYYDYIELLDRYGVPVAREMSDDSVIEKALGQLKQEGRIKP